MTYHLAQINIARLLAPIDDPLIADFKNQLDTINALGESSEGFVWRLKDDAGNATSYNPFGDELIIINMTVWESAEALMNFAYKSDHGRVFRDRRRWFDPDFELPSLALWWVEAGHTPSIEEGRDKIYQLHKEGASASVFTFKERFEAPIS